MGMANILYANIKHIVPFMFQARAKGSFGQLVKAIQSKQEWNIMDMYDSEIERDLYSIILDSFVMDEKENNVGCAFEYHVTPKQKNVLAFNYTRFEKDFCISISKAGLFLFRTGVVFLFYINILQSGRIP